MFHVKHFFWKGGLLPWGGDSPPFIAPPHPYLRNPTQFRRFFGLRTGRSSPSKIFKKNFKKMGGGLPRYRERDGGFPRYLIGQHPNGTTHSYATWQGSILTKQSVPMVLDRATRYRERDSRFLRNLTGQHPNETTHSHGARQGNTESGTVDSHGTWQGSILTEQHINHEYQTGQRRERNHT